MAEEIEQLIRSLNNLSEQIATLTGKNLATLQVVSTRTFAELMDCSTSAVAKGMKDGDFPKPSHKIFAGVKGWRWSPDEVQRFLDEKRIDKRIDDDDGPTPKYVSIRKRRVKKRT